MIKHYVKIALRNLSKQKGLSFINVFGLSVGLACFSLFLLYAVNEFSFDRFHKKGDDIYRVYLNIGAMHGEAEHGSSYLPIPLGPAMKQDLPEVEQFARLRDSWGESFVKADNNVSRVKVSYADPGMLSMFSFGMLHGNSANALNDPHGIIISKKKALQLFGQENVIGKTLEIKTESAFIPFTVTAVADDLPVNSTIQFDILGSFDYYLTTKDGMNASTMWQRSGYQTYVQLRKGSRLNEKTLTQFRKKYYPDEEESLKKDSLWTAAGSPINFRLQPLREMHTDIKVGGGGIEPVNPSNIWLLLAIAGAVLLIACINFTTLAIGRSAGRAKEVGVRKVIGSGKRQLVIQFLAEALLLSILSAVLGLLLGRLLLPYFNQLSGRELTFSFSQYPEMAWMLAGLVLLVGLLAGSYPALVLSGFKPIEVLKSKVRVGGSNIFTKSLVTLQFVLSIGLVISTAIILQQVKFMQDTDPGFNKENIVMVDAEGLETKKVYPLFKQAVSAQPAIAGIASAELGLGDGEGWSSAGFQYNGKNKQVYEYFVDADYVNVVGMKIIAGRNFDPKIASDTVTSVVVNEAMVKDFGWTVDNAVGQELQGYMETKTPVVIGVVKDFHFRPLSEKIAPQLFQQFNDYGAYKYFVKIKPGNPSAALDAMKKSWASIAPGYPFKYAFLDERLDHFYKSETRWSNIVGWAGGISIFLACLGLFGLAALAAVNRRKEIGIRKVLGISITGVIRLLSKDFVKLVAIALLIAAPLAWYFMQNWLNDFAYRINMKWWVFVLAGLAALLIAIITVSFQAIKTAIANPVKSLRTE